MEGNSSSTPVGSVHTLSTVNAAVNTLASASSTENGAHLTTAVAVVDERPIVVADPVEGSEKQEKGEKSKQKRLFPILALGLLAVVVIALSSGLTRRGATSTETSPSRSGSDTSVSSNESGVGESGSQENPIPEEDYEERREDVIALLEMLYEDFEGGVGVFEASHPFSSEDRIAALDWLVKEDIVPTPSPRTNASEAFMPDYEQQVYKLRQRYVLALLYFATNGENWDQKYNFLSAFDECQWTSIYTPDVDATYVEDEFSIKGAICNDKGQIEKLAMCK